MADNVTLNTSDTGGAIVHTDELSGNVHVQRVKIGHGTNGSYADVTSAAGLPCILVTGSAVFGKLAANSGVDIGDVDVLSIAAGDNNIGNVDIVTIPAPLNVTGGGTEAAALRVTIASNSTGVITVDGTITANLSAIDNAVLDAIDAVLDTIKIDTEAIETAVEGTLTTVGSYSEDVAVPSPIVGGAVMMERDDDRSEAPSLDGNWVSLKSNKQGGLWTAAEGGTAHDEVDSGYPVKIGAKALSAEPAAVAASDRTNLVADLTGKLITLPYALPELFVNGNASNTDGTSTVCIAAQAAGVRTFLTTIVLTNVHASTDTFVEIKDGAAAKMTIPVPASGGAIVNLPVPLRGTAATAWNFDPGAAITTMYCSMVGYTGV